MDRPKDTTEGKIGPIKEYQDSRETTLRNIYINIK